MDDNKSPVSNISAEIINYFDLTIIQTFNIRLKIADIKGFKPLKGYNLHFTNGGDWMQNIHFTLSLQTITETSNTYSFNVKDKTAVLTKNKCTDKIIKVPDTITKNNVEYKVISIENFAFERCVCEEIIFGDNITSISTGFSDWSPFLQTVRFGKNVNFVANQIKSQRAIMHHTENLKQIIVDEQNPYIHSINNNCLVMNAGTKEAPSYTILLKATNNLTAISTSITSIYPSAFADLNSLLKITIPSSVISIGSEAFCNCYSLSKVTFEENSQLVLLNSETFWNCYSLSSINLPASLRAIDFRCFDGCVSLSNITLPSNLLTIGQGAFSECSNLSAINLPASIISIGNGAFLLCTALETIKVDSANTIYTSQDDSGNEINGIWLKDKDSLGNKIIVSGCKNSKLTAFDSIVIYDFAFAGSNIINVDLSRVSSMGTSAFEFCMSLESVTFGENGYMLSIPNRCFDRCVSLTNISLPKSISQINDWAFSNCFSLVSIAIPDSVQRIGKFAFDNCISLEKVEINDTSILETIDASAFSSNISLTTITIPTSVQNIENNAFTSDSKLIAVYFKDPKNWKNGSSAVDEKVLSNPTAAADLLKKQGTVLHKSATI